jgi:hypothetical protein
VQGVRCQWMCFGILPRERRKGALGTAQKTTSQLGADGVVPAGQYFMAMYAQ